MAVERKQYSVAFKQEAVRLMTREGVSAAQVANDLGINASLLGKWKRQLEAGQQARVTGRHSYVAFPGQGHSLDEELTSAQGAPGAARMRRYAWSVMF